MCSKRCAKPLRPCGSSRNPILSYTPTVTTGAVVSGAITTFNPFASVVLSMPTCSRFTRCPPLLLLSLLLLLAFCPIRPASRQHPATAAAPPIGSALLAPAQIQPETPATPPSALPRH